MSSCGSTARVSRWRCSRPEAVVAGRKASLEQAELDLKRYKELTTAAVSQQKQEQVLATQLLAKASLDQAVADRAVAQLNLDRSEVHARRSRA